MNKTSEHKAPLIIYHGGCVDGFTAAYIAHDAWARLDTLPPELYPASYNTDPPDVTGRRVAIVDFSYPKEVLVNMCKVAIDIMVLDHHKTAIEDLVFGHGEQPANLFLELDDTRSGAMITWDFFHPSALAPMFVKHVQDRDLWTFDLIGTEDFFAGVTSHPMTVEAYDAIFDHPQGVISEGVGINRYRQELIKVAVENAQVGWIDGHKVPVVNCIYAIASDVAGALAAGEDVPFAAYYFDTPSGRSYGLRSAPHGIDVSEVAKKFGGGGHKHAAGFKRPGYGVIFLETE
jgi:uncharacterized protein